MASPPLTMRPGTEHSVAAWASASWRAAAVSWLDEQLGAAGIERVGEVEQPHLRPWATVLRPRAAAPCG